MAAAALGAHPKRGVLYRGHTAQSQKLTGPGANRVAFRVAPNGKKMVFQGRVNLQGDHCIDTLSDRANAKRGAGHVAPDLAIDSNGKFHGSITETFPSGSDTTSITGHTSNGKLAGTIRGNEPPNNRFPSGCKIKTTFTARAT